MAFYKPVHVITNDPFLWETLHHFHLEDEHLDYPCYTCDGKEHEHHHWHWKVNHLYALVPTKAGLVKHARRHRGCSTCHNKPWNHTCPTCGLYYKFIWLSSDHHQSVHHYIIKKHIQQFKNPDPRLLEITIDELDEFREVYPDYPWEDEEIDWSLLEN